MKNKRILIIAIALILISMSVFYYIGKDAKYYNINTMDRQELIDKLSAINQIGIEIATRVADNRPYADIHDLKNKVTGVGARRADKILKYFTIK